MNQHRRGMNGHKRSKEESISTTRDNARSGHEVVGAVRPTALSAMGAHPAGCSPSAFFHGKHARTGAIRSALQSVPTAPLGATRRFTPNISILLVIVILTLPLLAGCFLTGVDVADQPQVDPGVWAQYRLEPRHRGTAAAGTTIGTDCTLKWKSDALAIGTYTASKSSPAVDETLVYIGVDDGSLYALHRDDGSIVWRFKTRRFETEQAGTDEKHHGIHGTPAFDEENVYIGDYDGWLYAVAKGDGSLVWEKKLGHSIGASPVLYGGYIFIAVEYWYPDGRIFVVDKNNGWIGYHTPFLGNHPHSSVSIDPERQYMFVGANNGYLFCYDFSRAELVWKAQTGGDIKSTAAVGQDIVYITSWSDKLHAYSIETGAELFTYETEASSMSSPSLSGGSVYFGSHDGNLYSVDDQTGELNWSTRIGYSVQASPTIVEDSGLVIIGSRSNNVAMLDVETGESVWTRLLDGDMTSVPVVVEGELYVNDDSGTLWCFQ